MWIFYRIAPICFCITPDRIFFSATKIISAEQDSFCFVTQTMKPYQLFTLWDNSRTQSYCWKEYSFQQTKHFVRFIDTLQPKVCNELFKFWVIKKQRHIAVMWMEFTVSCQNVVTLHWSRNGSDANIYIYSAFHQKSLNLVKHIYVFVTFLIMLWRREVIANQNETSCFHLASPGFEAGCLRHTLASRENACKKLMEHVLSRTKLMHDRPGLPQVSSQDVSNLTQKKRMLKCWPQTETCHWDS